MAGIISQILTGDETTRDRCFKFLSTKFKNLGSDIITKDVEEFLITDIKKILQVKKENKIKLLKIYKTDNFFIQDVTAQEFHICMTILGSTKLGSSVTGHQELVALATEQAELDAEIEPAIEDEIVERFIQCSNHALPYFSVSFRIFVP